MPILLLVLIVILIIKILFDEDNMRKIENIIDAISDWFGGNSADANSLGSNDFPKNKIDFNKIDTGEVVSAAINKCPTSSLHEAQKLSEQEIVDNICNQFNKVTALQPYGAEIKLLSRKIATAVKAANPA